MEEIVRAEKLQPAMAVIVHGGNRRNYSARRAIFFFQLNLRSNRRAFAGAEHRPPVVRRVFFEQQDFKFPAGFGIPAVQARRDDARVVQHQDIAGVKIFQQPGKVTMLGLTGFSVQNEQARSIPFWGGNLRDQLRREIEMKVSGSHRRVA